ALAGGVLARLGVVFGLDEGFPQDGGHSEPGGGGLLLFAVDAFGVLPLGGFDRDGVADDLFVHGAPAPGLDRHGAPADRVAGTGFDHGGGHSPAQGVLEGDVFDVDTVDRAEPGTVGIGHLIGVVPGPAFSVLVNAQVGMRLHETGQHPFAPGVDHLGSRRHGCVRPAHRTDAPVGDDHGALFDRRRAHRYHAAPGDGGVSLRAHPPSVQYRRPAHSTPAIRRVRYL